MTSKASFMRGHTVIDAAMKETTNPTIRNATDSHALAPMKPSPMTTSTTTVPSQFGHHSRPWTSTAVVMCEVITAAAPEAVTPALPGFFRWTTTAATARTTASE